MNDYLNVKLLYFPNCFKENIYDTSALYEMNLPYLPQIIRARKSQGTKIANIETESDVAGASALLGLGSFTGYYPSYIDATLKDL